MARIHKFAGFLQDPGRSVEILLVLLNCIPAQLFYSNVLHLPFEAAVVEEYPLYLDTALLRHDLWRSLYYLHAAPPLMNWLLGTIMQCVSNYGTALWLIHLVAGAAAVYVLHRAFMLLGIGRLPRLFVLFWLPWSPAFLRYTNWAYTTHLEFCLCTVLVYSLSQYSLPSRGRGFCDALRLFIPCCLLGMLRAQWHVLVFGCMLALILWLREGGKSRYALGAGLALSPLLVLYLKNFLLFGFFGASSWLGMNLSQVTGDLLRPAQLQALRSQGDVSPFFPVDFDADRAKDVRSQWEMQGSAVQSYGHASLERFRSNGQKNYNFLAFVEGGKQDLADSRAIIRHYPGLYARRVAARLAAVVTHPTMIDARYQMVIDAMGGDPAWWPAMKRWMSPLFVLFYVALPLLALGLALRRGGYLAQHRRFVLPGIFLVTAMLLISCAVNGGEQERMRWGTEPFFLTFFALSAEAIMRRFFSPARRSG